MTKQKLFLYLLFLVGMAQSVMAQEPYAVLSNNNTMLTFYYDTQKTARGGMSVGPFEYDDNSSRPNTSWYPKIETIASVVFDASFADCTSLTSTAYWFTDCAELKNISGIENLKTDNVTNMAGMFSYCSSLTSLDLSGFKTDKVTDMNSMFSDCGSLTSLDLSRFKTDNVTNMSGMFYRCSSLTSLDLSGFKTDNVTNMYYMFRGCSNLTTIYASNNWNTEKVTDRSRMFHSCTKLVGGQGTAYDASHTDHTYARIDGGTAAPGYFTEKTMPKAMPYAVLSNDNTVLTFYYDAQKAARGGMSVGPFESTPSWYPQRETIATVVFDASFADCTSLTSTAAWFYGCTNLNTISGFENLKTENVTDMSAMFHKCSSLTNLDVSGFKTDNVTNMVFMFSGCERLTSLDLGSFKTDNVTNMRYMFRDCNGLTSLDLSSFKTDNVMDMSYMFSGCNGLTTIYASKKWSTEKVTNGGYMFNGCKKLVGGEGTAYDARYTDYTYARIDGGTTAPGYFTMPKVMPYAVLSNDNTVLTFYYDTQKTARGGISVGPFEYDYNKNHPTTSWYPQRGTIATVVFDASFADYTELTSTSYWFFGCTNLTTISGIENLKTDNVTDMINMFSDCRSLTSLDVSGFKTENVTNMFAMFAGCWGLTSLDLSGFKTDNVTNMGSMFINCWSLTSLDLSSFKTDNVTDMSLMFCSCRSLTNLDLSGFKTDNVTNMYCMFERCESLTTIYVSNNWSTEKVTSGDHMFTDCTKLVGGQGTAYDASHTDHTYARIDGGTSVPGYFTEKSGTGIRGLNADSNADNAPVYDLSGRRVQVPAKGIYVKNGKKFVNK